MVRLFLWLIRQRRLVVDDRRTSLNKFQRYVVGGGRGGGEGGEGGWMNESIVTRVGLCTHNNVLRSTMT